MTESGQIVVIANAGSGRKASGEDPTGDLVAALDARLHEFAPGDDIGGLVGRAVAEGAATVVASGGDGTIMAVADALRGSDVTMGLMPSGTFNFFARGFGIPPEPDVAAAIIRDGQVQRLSLGTVNGKVFLNNMSIGVYPAILKEREDVYRRWGRSRLAAYWSVVRTFLRAQRLVSLRLDHDGRSLVVRTPLVFVARSAYQLEHFGLPGADAVAGGRFAIFIGPDRGRFALFLNAFRLARGKMEEGRDFRLILADEATLHIRKPAVLVAVDGEKLRLRPPLHLKIERDCLTLLVPGPGQAVAA